MASDAPQLCLLTATDACLQPFYTEMTESCSIDMLKAYILVTNVNRQLTTQQNESHA